jgi:hypothetical protein
MLSQPQHLQCHCKACSTAAAACFADTQGALDLLLTKSVVNSTEEQPCQLDYHLTPVEVLTQSYNLWVRWPLTQVLV